MMNSEVGLTAQSYPVNQPNNTMNNPNVPRMQYVPQSTYQFVQPLYQPAQTLVMSPIPAFQNTTFISGGAVSTGSVPIYRSNQQIFCRNCHCLVMTNIDFQPGAGTFLMCLMLSLCIGLFGFIAFCIDDCKDCTHYCGRCGSYLGKVRYLLD